MTSRQDVTRWTDAASDDAEVPPELRRLLQASRQQIGTPLEVASLTESLARRLGPEAGLGPSAAPTGVAPTGVAPTGLAPMPAATRWAAWFSAGGAVVAGAVTWWALGSRSLPEPALEASPPLVSSQPAERVLPPQPPEPVVGAEVTSEPAPAAASEPAPAAERASEPAARPSAPKRAAPRPRAHTAERHSEAELLERAQAALATRPKDALALTREHQRRFPRGLLVQEREVIAIEALSRLGQRRAADAKAAEFEERYRGSVHQPRLDGDMDRAPATGGSVPHVEPAR